MDRRRGRQAQTTLRVLVGLPQTFLVRMMHDIGNDETPQCPA